MQFLLIALHWTVWTICVVVVEGKRWVVVVGRASGKKEFPQANRNYRHKATVPHTTFPSTLVAKNSTCMMLRAMSSPEAYCLYSREQQCRAFQSEDKLF